MKGKRPHFRLTCVAQKSLCLSSLTTSKERLQKFHTDDVSLPEIWIIKATSFPGSLSYLSLLSRTGRREPWERVNFPRGTSDQSKELLYRDLGIAPFSSAESLCVVGFLYFFFFDYCYFYRNTQREPPQRREVLRVISMEFLCSFLRRHW